MDCFKYVEESKTLSRSSWIILFNRILFFEKNYINLTEYKKLSIFVKKKAMNEDKQFRILLAVTSVVWLILVGVLIVI